MGERVDAPRSFQRLKERPHIEAGRRQQRGGERVLWIEWGGIVPSEAGPRDNAPHQRKSIGMDAGRRQAEHKVPWLQSRPRQQRAALGGADGEAGDVEIASRIKAGHLRRLAADQCAPRLRAALGDALHHGGRDVLVELA